MKEELKKTFENLVHITKAPDYLPGISLKTFRNWRALGVYPSIWVKLGGKVFVDLQELAQIIGEQKKKTVVRIKQLTLFDDVA